MPDVARHQAARRAAVGRIALAAAPIARSRAGNALATAAMRPRHDSMGPIVSAFVRTVGASRSPPRCLQWQQHLRRPAVDHLPRDVGVPRVASPQA